MKTTKYTFIALLAAASVAVFSPVALGQNAGNKEKPAATDNAARGPRQGQGMNIDRQMERMTKDLTLTKKQADEIKAILKEQQEKMAKLREEKATREDMTAARKVFTEKIDKVLTKEQIEKQKELQKERAANRGTGNRQNRQNRAPQ